MKHYSYNTWKTNPSIDSYVETLSEADILKDHWEWWKERMILKYGKERFEANYSEKDCIEDWTVVNWAWETNEQNQSR
jgi:hypothetical protein